MIPRSHRWIVSGAFVFAAVAVATPLLAGSASVSVKSVGTAEVKWNGIPFQQKHMDALSPGLTWRMGMGGPTRLDLKKMALIGGSGMVLPGESTLNLRYWGPSNWELVVFEEKEWKWSPDFKQLGVFPFEVGRVQYEKDSIDDLQMRMRSLKRKDATVVFQPAVTGGPTKVQDFIPKDALSEAALKQFEESIIFEFEVQYGPHLGLARFDAATVGTTRSTVKTDAGKKKYELQFAEYTDVLARTERCEAEIALVLGIFTIDGAEKDALMLEVTGGEVPSLWPIRRQSRDELDFIQGTRVETKGAKAAPKQISAELDGATLTVHLNKVDYVFELNL